MTKRAGSALVLLLLAGGASASLMAQTPGLPLFTNPRYATGLRVHADLGQPTDQGTAVGDQTVIQGGASFVLGPVSVNAFVPVYSGVPAGLVSAHPPAPASLSESAEWPVLVYRLRNTLTVFRGTSSAAPSRLLSS